MAQESGAQEQAEGGQPPDEPPPEGDQVAIDVPRGVRPGHTKLAVQVDGSRQLLVTVPPEAVAGDRLLLRRGPGKEAAWACTLSRPLHCAAPPCPAESGAAQEGAPPAPECGRRITFLVPPSVRVGETKLSVDAGGEKVVLRVPAGAAPGDKVILTKSPAGPGTLADGTGEAAEGTWRCTLVRERLAHGEAGSGRQDLERIANLPPPRAVPDADAACRRLFEAARAAGATVSSKLVRGSAPPLGIPGLLAAEPIEAGEVLCSIPARLHISPVTVERLAPKLWEATAGLKEVPAARRSEVAQAVFVALLLQGAEDRALTGASQQHMAVGSAVDLDVLTVWQSYADDLLKEDFESHPYRRAAADPRAICSVFDPSTEAHFFLDMAQDICTVHAVLAQKIPPAECFAEHHIELGMFLRARLSILSRVFQTENDSTLVPVADLFNHAPATCQGASWYWDEEQSTLVVTADRAHGVGEELLCSYGPRSNLLLLRTYGFTLPPEAEPSWSYVVRAPAVKSIYELFLPEGEREPPLVLDSALMEDSLCQVLNVVARGGRDPAEFLRLVAARCLWPYEQSTALQPALAALRRARDLEGASHAWWSQLAEADRHLASSDVTRVQMCEYLCLTGHLEAVDLAEGLLEEGRCLGGARAIRQLLCQALRVLQEKRGFAVRLVPEAERA